MLDYDTVVTAGFIDPESIASSELLAEMVKIAMDDQAEFGDSP